MHGASTVTLNTFPKAVLVINGKRKAGKDYISQLFLERFEADNCVIIRLSGPLKKQYALEKGLDFQCLMDSSDYKEKFRSDMIRWGEEKRNLDPDFFCRAATSGDEARRSIWIISDARRKTDIDYFKTHFRDITRTVRILASERTRKTRGFIFTQGVDDAESECGLDDVEVDVEIINDGDDVALEKSLQEIEHLVNVRIPQGNG